MFKSAAILSAAVLATAGFASPASAATITPSPIAYPNLKFTGTLSIQQSGSTTFCAVTLVGYVPNPTIAIITGGSFDPGSWQCGSLVSPTGFPWYLQPNSAYSVTLLNISFNTILGYCSGSVTTSWANGPPSGITFVGASIPGSPDYCTISGTLRSSPTLTIS